jgi:hypothetical protein
VFYPQQAARIQARGNILVHEDCAWLGPLKPLRQREATSTEILNRLRRASAKVPGIALFGQARQDVQIGAR